MLILAKSIKGAEFMYDGLSAHKVSKKSAHIIMDALNEHGYHLKENQTWYLHNVDAYDNAYYIAESQKFTIYKGTIREYR